LLYGYFRFKNETDWYRVALIYETQSNRIIEAILVRHWKHYEIIPVRWQSETYDGLTDKEIKEIISRWKRWELDDDKQIELPLDQPVTASNFVH